MRIGILTSGFLPKLDGAVRSVCDQALKLGERGHDVTILTRRLAHTSARETWHGINIRRLRPSGFSYSSRIAFAANLARQASMSNFDVLHAHGVSPGIGAAAASKGKGASVVTFHGLRYLYGRSLWYRGAGSYKLGKAATRILAHHVDSIIAQSSAIKSLLMQLFGEELDRRISIIPHPVDLNRFEFHKYHLHRERREILYVGTLSRRKGADVLIRAAPHILREFPKATFTFVGSGPLLRRLQSMVDNLGVRNVVKFRGRLNDSELAKCYESCDVFVFPTFGEWLGIVLLEAMASGRPVIASRVFGPRDIVTEDIGVLFEAGNSEELAEAVTRILSDRRMAARMGEKARAIVERDNDIETVTSMLEKLYAKI